MVSSSIWGYPAEVVVGPFFAIENHMGVHSWYFSAFSTVWPDSKCLWENQKSSLAILQYKLDGPEQEPSWEVRKEIYWEKQTPGLYIPF